jgi:hypothetical protein
MSRLCLICTFQRPLLVHIHEKALKQQNVRYTIFNGFTCSQPFEHEKVFILNFFFLSVSIDLYLYVSMYLPVSMYTYTSMYVIMYAFVYECTYVCIHVCMYVCKYVCMYVCKYVRMYVCLYVCKYVCMHVHSRASENLGGFNSY